MFLQYCVGLLPNENSNFEDYSINYLIACRKRERDPEAFLINAVIVSDPAPSLASQWHYQTDLHTRRFF